MQPLKASNATTPLQPMKQFVTLLAVLSLAPLTSALAQSQPGVPASVKLNVRRDIPYAEPADPRQKVDIYAPEGAKNLPVVFWIHGGGWQTGGRAGGQGKPPAVGGRGFGFLSPGCRPLPHVGLGSSFLRHPTSRP